MRKFVNCTKQIYQCFILFMSPCATHRMRWHHICPTLPCTCVKQSFLPQEPLMPEIVAAAFGKQTLRQRQRRQRPIKYRSMNPKKTILATAAKRPPPLLLLLPLGYVPLLDLIEDHKEGCIHAMPLAFHSTHTHIPEFLCVVCLSVGNE